MFNKYSELCEMIGVPEACRSELIQKIDQGEDRIGGAFFGRSGGRFNAAAALVIGMLGLAMLGITGIAASAFLSSLFDERLHIENEKEANDAVSVGAVTYPEEISATDNGITVTLVEAACDHYGVLLALKIEGDVLLEQDRVFADHIRLLIDGEEVSDAGGELTKSESGDYYEFLVPYYAKLFEKEINQKEVELIIRSFSGSIHPEMAHSIENEVVAEGMWDLKWVATGNTDLDYFDCGSGKRLYENGPVVKNITLTSMMVKVEYDYPRQVAEKHFVHPDGFTNTWSELVYPPVPVAFLMEDGSIRRFSVTAPGMSGYVEDDDQTFIYSHATNIIVDPFQVEAVLFLDRDSEYIGTDKEYGVKELPLDAYYMVSGQAEQNNEK